LYVGFENPAFRFVGTYWKYFRVGEKTVLRMNVFRMGRHGKGNGVPCITVGNRKEDKVRYLKDFIMDDGCQYIV